MKILVCLTCVPDTTAKITFTNNDTQLNKAGVQFIVGPYDDYALSRAIEIKEQFPGSTVTLVNVGTAESEPILRKGLALGAEDAFRVDAEPTDAYFVALQIAALAKQNNYDLIMMGRESIDFNGGQVHGMVAEMLGIPSVSPVMKLDIEGSTAKMTREIEGGKEYLEVPLPLVAGCQEPIAEWKIPNMRGIMSAKTKPLQVIKPFSEDVLTAVGKFQLPPPKGAVKMIPADEAGKLIGLLRTEAKII
jgi:electron transfer flavoprotein beta subunit